MSTQPDFGLTAQPLSDVPVERVLALLAAERENWSRRLHWQAGALGDALEMAVQCGLLPGVVVSHRGRILGYMSHHAGPDVFRPCGFHVEPGAPPGAVEALVEATLAHPAARRRRVEAQVHAFAAREELDAAFRLHGLRVVPRAYLCLELDGDERPAPAPAGYRLDGLSSACLDRAARVLVAAHAGGIESEINAAFRRPARARAYLAELLGGTGCGQLDLTATRAAWFRGELVGFCAVSRIGPRAGHVPQVAVAPEHAGSGVGRALLGHALAGLRRAGADRVTLSVSRENRLARDWYLRLGFRELEAFSAHVRG